MVAKPCACNRLSAALSMLGSSSTTATILRPFSMKCLGFRLTGKRSQAQIFDHTRFYDRIDARRDLSLGEVHLDTALVGPRKAFAKCNRRKLNSLCSNTRSLSRCELQAAPPTCVGYACRLGMPIERRVRGCLFRFFLRSFGTFASSAVGDRQ